MQSQLAVLHAEERTARAALENIVYPILTLPTDVTTEIFQHYAGDPSTLASVCRQWREVAFSFPRLWPALPAPPGQSGRRWPFRPPGLASLLRSRLSRVGSLPFRLEPLLSPTDETLSILAPYFPQLSKLKLLLSGLS
ncbi:hypothetical protein FB45DRAFT_754624 [Roridomyces roridus]|uniref:F-box domain-containing protein n=1 Tax=Roridomyces roridus TaxID=1738132 RepID=A0AAD7BGD9_9AGAR|nr:hypothetical protein FB45DRAFT_754624 [Roridomyces roridus]